MWQITIEEIGHYNGNCIHYCERAFIIISYQQQIPMVNVDWGPLKSNKYILLVC